MVDDYTARMNRSFVLLVLIGCSSVSNKSSDAGGQNPPACTSTVKPNVLVADFSSDIKRGEPSVVGDDIFWVDASQGAATMFASKTGVIMHMKVTDTAPATAVTPTGYVYSATALGADILYLQDAPTTNVVHLYRAPIAGGAGTDVGAEIPIGGQTIQSQDCGNCRVFGRKGDDVFVAAAGEIDRVNLVSGQKTVIAQFSGRPTLMKGLYMEELVNDTVYYTEQDGAIFSVSSAASTPSATRLGSATCKAGLLGYKELRAYSGGFLCDEGSSIDRIDSMGTPKGAVFDSTLADHNVSSFMPSAISGTTYWATPSFAPQQDTDVSAIYKADVSGGAPTAAVCNVHAVQWTALGTTQLVYIDVVASVTSLRSIPH